MGNLLGALHRDHIVAFASAVVGWARGGCALPRSWPAIFAGIVGRQAPMQSTGAIGRAMRRAGYRRDGGGVNAAAASGQSSLLAVVISACADASIEDAASWRHLAC